MSQALYRAKIYKTFQLPGKPAVRWPIMFGPWVEDSKRAQNLVTLLGKLHPDTDPWLQKAERLAS